MKPPSPAPETMVRVFLVDDHTIVRQGVRALLAATPDLVVVGEASDATECLARLPSLAPEVAVVDLSLPGMHGTDLVRRLKADFPVKILVLSMHASPEVVERVRDAGADGYVVKGSDVAELAAAIRSVAAGQPYFSSAVSPAERGRGATRPVDRLSSRERQILRLIAQSGTNKTIASELGISIHTVNAHRVSLMAKLDIHDSQGLTRFAIENGLLGPEPG